MNKIDKQWQLVKDYNHSIIRTHWGGSDEPPREVDSREEPEEFGSSSLFEKVVTN